MKSKLVVFILSVAMLLSLCACEGEKKEVVCNVCGGDGRATCPIKARALLGLDYHDARYCPKNCDENEETGCSNCFGTGTTYE